mgnify:CR=1 FL=1
MSKKEITIFVDPRDTNKEILDSIYIEWGCGGIYNNKEEAKKNGSTKKVNLIIIIE